MKTTKLVSILNIVFIPLYGFFLWFFANSPRIGFFGVLYMVLILGNLFLHILKKDISQKIPRWYPTLKNVVISLSIVSSTYFIVWLYFALNYLISTLP